MSEDKTPFRGHELRENFVSFSLSQSLSLWLLISISSISLCFMFKQSGNLYRGRTKPLGDQKGGKDDRGGDKPPLSLPWLHKWGGDCTCLHVLATCGMNSCKIISKFREIVTQTSIKESLLQVLVSRWLAKYGILNTNMKI